MRPPANNPFLTTRNDPDSMLHRVAELDRSAINDKDRTVEIAFSSEAPVERYFGTEVLGHEATNVRLGRLNNGGAVLVEHDRRDQVGVVVKASIDKDRKGRATIRFGKSARAEEIFQDVKDGIRRLVSVGYRIHKQETKNEAGGVESVRVTDWEPFELSLVSIPADDSVGVGRGEPSADEPNHSLSD
jgi:HK97 family phage prohead protease